MTYLPRSLAGLPAAVLATVVVVVCVRVEAAEPRVNMKQVEVSASQVTAPSDKGTGVLTLDPGLQRDVASLLRRARAPEAGAVVIDVQTGKVLAWASVDGRGRDLVAQPYGPPASLFKVVTAAALLENSEARATTRQCYVGGERRVHLEDLRRSAGGGAMCSPLSTAVGHSRNMVMAGLAVRFLDAKKLQTMADKLGFNGSVPIDIQVGTGSCQVPSTQEGLARAAAGFGAGHLTPLEAAYMMTVIARNGRRPALRLVDHVVARDGRRLGVPPPAAGTSWAFGSATARELRRMLEVTVQEGTAARSFRDGHGKRYLGRYGGAGKTGTLSGGKPRRLFSWYAGYAPADHPRVAVAVMLANDHRWWKKGSEVARDVLRAYFAREQVSGISHPIRGRTARRSE